MTKVNELWMPFLLGMLLMGTLVGVAGARPNARPEASPALQDHMISAQHCIPSDNTYPYVTGPHLIACMETAAPCCLVCPIKPPHEGLIRVQRLAMYVYDNGAGEVCLWLEHFYPKTGTYVERLASQCTFNDATDPQLYVYNPANFKVSVLQDIVVGVNFTGTTQKLYGFKLKYEPL